MFVADARTGAPAKTSASSRARIPTVKGCIPLKAFRENGLLLFEWFAAFVAVVLAERRGSTEQAPQSNAAVHAELSTSRLLVMTDRTGLGGLGLRNGQYEAHSCRMTDSLAERVLLTGWWCFLPVQCLSNEKRWRRALNCFVFSCHYGAAAPCLLEYDNDGNSQPGDCGQNKLEYDSDGG